MEGTIKHLYKGKMVSGYITTSALNKSLLALRGKMRRGSLEEIILKKGQKCFISKE